jgi:hypothetical protein
VEAAYVHMDFGKVTKGLPLQPNATAFSSLCHLAKTLMIFTHYSIGDLRPKYLSVDLKNHCRYIGVNKSLFQKKFPLFYALRT